MRESVGLILTSDTVLYWLLVKTSLRLPVKQAENLASVSDYRQWIYIASMLRISAFLAEGPYSLVSYNRQPGPHLLILG